MTFLNTSLLTDKWDGFALNAFKPQSAICFTAFGKDTGTSKLKLASGNLQDCILIVAKRWTAASLRCQRSRQSNGVGGVRVFGDFSFDGFEASVTGARFLCLPATCRYSFFGFISNKTRLIKKHITESHKGIKTTRHPMWCMPYIYLYEDITGFFLRMSL